MCLFLERLCLSAGLGAPWNTPLRVGGSVCGEETLGISAAPTNQFQIKRRDDNRKIIIEIIRDGLEQK